MIKEYKYKNTYSIAVAAFVAIFYLCAVCFTKMNLQRISFYTVFLILFGIDIYRNANITIELYEDKVIQRQGKKNHVTLYFTEVTKLQSFGWYHVPLCWKSVVMQNANKDSIYMRSIGCKAYKELWLEVYERVNEHSEMALTNDNLEKAIEKIKAEERNNLHE